MTYKEYLEGVNKTWKSSDKFTEDIHCRLAIIEEVGEIAGWYKKHYGYGKVKDESWKVGLLGECGDLLFYLTKISEIHNKQEPVQQMFNLLPDKNAVSSPISNIYELSLAANSLLVTSVYTFDFEERLADIVNFLFDIMVYEGFTMEDVCLSNLSKLSARHGSSFNSKSIMEEGRDREAEDKAISDGTNN